MNINDIQTFVLYNGMNSVATISIVLFNGMNSVATKSIILYNGMNSVATISVVPTELATCTDKCRRHDLYCNPVVLTPGYISRIPINPVP